MILFQVDTPGLTIGKFKCEAPRAVDMNRVARRIESIERVKIESRKVHFLWPGDDIQPVKPDQNTAVKIYINP